MAISQKSFSFNSHHRLQRKADLQSTTLDTRIDPKSADHVQGHVFWFPTEEDVPRRTAIGTHGNDLVEGPNGYLIVVASSPAEESLLAYTNPRTTDMPRPRLERWFIKPLLDSNQVVNKQESGLQYQSHPLTRSIRIGLEPRSDHTEPALYRSASEPQSLPRILAQKPDARMYPGPDAASRVLNEYSGSFSSPQSALETLGVVGYGIDNSNPQVSRDLDAKPVARNSISWNIWQPIDRVLKRVATEFEGETMTKRFVVRRPMTRFWVNTKGVIAIAIASI